MLVFIDCFYLTQTEIFLVLGVLSFVFFFFFWILDIFGFKLWDSGSYLNFPI